MGVTRRCGEDCSLCRRGLAHPPLMVAYDKRERGYGVPDDPVCMAHWASAGRQHAEGDICGELATEVLGDVDLCSYHFDRARTWFWKRYAEAPLEWQAKREAAEEADREAARIARDTRSVVYHLLSEQTRLIKIGYSSNYRARLSTLQGEHGPLRLLLAVPGARKEEKEAHGEFVEHWERGEWFRPGKSLLLYIQRTRRWQRSEGGRPLLPEAVPLEEVRALIRALPKAA